jgi:hypothetical protein
MVKKKSAPSAIYQIKVTLKELRPPIWRRIQVADNTSLGKLHGILQVAMGWTDSHLHQFTIDGIDYGVPSPDDFRPVMNESRVKLSQVVTGEKFKFLYEYDFGDSWMHELLVEKILPPEEGVHYPRCLKGKNAAPPEDCGGPWGYVDLLAILQDPKHPEHEEMLEWAGGPSDPEAFDLEGINAALQEIR